MVRVSANNAPTYSKRSSGPWELRTLDTSIQFRLHRGRTLISKLQAAPSKKRAQSHNWASGVDEVALPETVEVEGDTQTVSWVYDGATADDGQISFKYHSDSPRMEVVSVWEAARLPGPVEHSITLTNNDTQAIVFTPRPTILIPLKVGADHTLENWWVEKGAGDVTDVGTHSEPVTSGYTRILRSGPHSSDGEDRDAIPWFCIQDSTAKHGLYGGIEFSGWTQILIRKISTDTIFASLGLQGKARTRVNPGGVFKFPTCFIGVYQGDVDDGCNRLHRWVEQRLRPAIPGGITPLLVNNSWGSGQKVDEDLARRMIDGCASLGIELYHIDAGWFKNVGDWHPNPAKFPNGIEKVADYAHSKGLKFGLWVGWTQGSAQKDAGEDILSVYNPSQRNWFGLDYGPDWRQHASYKGAPVCLGSPEARAWCLRELRRMIKDYKLDLLEHDQVMIVDKCIREGHGHIPDDPADTSRAAAEGYYEIYDQILKENPNLLLENCVSGGRLVDFGVAKRTHYVCATDTYTPLSLRRAFYDASYPLPPSMVEAYIGSHPGSTLANFKYMLRSAMLGWCTIMIDTAAWSPDRKEAAKRQFQLYKENLRPLIASGNLYHILPRPDNACWDGVLYVDPNTGKGALLVFRPQTDKTTETIVLRGLDPKKKYSVEAEDSSVPEKIASGRELMESGLTVQLPERDSSDLIFLTQQPPTFVAGRQSLSY